MDATNATAPQETKLHFLDYWRIIRIRKTVILAVFLLVVITATLVTFILPEQYSSRARIKVQRDQSDISELMDRSGVPGAYDPYFIQTEFEVITSELILGKVVEDLKLNQVLAEMNGMSQPLKTEESMEIIRRKTKLRPVRNTSIIEIEVTDPKPEEAARLANAIATAYRNHRLETRKQLSQGGIEALKEYLDKQEEKVKEAQREVDELRQKLGIPDAVALSEAPTMLMSAETLRRLEGLRIESQAEYVRAETMLNKLKELSPEELEQALPTANQAVLLGSFLEQLNIA